MILIILNLIILKVLVLEVRMKYLSLIVVFMTLVVAQINPPKITSPKDFHNFGDIKEGETVFYDFIIKNTGEDLLIINDVQPSCGCTAAEPEKRRLLPGESTKMKVEFNTINRKGPQTKIVYVLTNDPKTPKFKLWFSANIIAKTDSEKANEQVARIKIDKNYINIGDIKQGQKKSSVVYIKNVGKKELVINDIKSSCDCIKTEISSKRLAPGEEEKLTIEFDSAGKTGKISRSLVLVTNDPYDTYNYITIFATIN